MKNESLVLQRNLIESSKMLRKCQIEDLKVAVTSFQTESRFREAGTFGCVAMYLAALAEWLDIQIATELGGLNRSLPSTDSVAPVDHRSAMILGGLDGACQLGEISAALIAHSQRALSKASLLALCGNSKEQLQAFDDTTEDAIFAMLFDLNKLPGETPQQIRTCGALTASFDKRCNNAAKSAELTIASVSTASCALITARVLKQLAIVLDSPSSAGLYPEAAIGNFKVSYIEMTVGKLVAECMAADIICDFVRKRLNFVSVSLN